VLSGVQPSGALHLGNYLGALRQWSRLGSDYDCYFCIVDLHALTSPVGLEKQRLVEKAREVAALYIACGIDPTRTHIFSQSAVAEHTQLMWYLMCITPVGALQRMTQFKSKSARGTAIQSGLLTYPVLMAADILLYQTDFVPVGDDQKQHIELARDLAQRFNTIYGDTFKVPDVRTPVAGSRVMALDNPDEKMSKNLDGQRPNHAVGLLDSRDVVRKKIARAVTDAGSGVNPSELSPGVRNLIEISAALVDTSFAVRLAEVAGLSYGALKSMVAEQISDTLSPIQKSYSQLVGNPQELDLILERGAMVARAKASLTLLRVEQAMGLRE
jgi:tryptophanyl-tRNA synthetase